MKLEICFEDDQTPWIAVAFDGFYRGKDGYICAPIFCLMITEIYGRKWLDSIDSTLNVTYFHPLSTQF